MLPVALSATFYQQATTTPKAVTSKLTVLNAVASYTMVVTGLARTHRRSGNLPSSNIAIQIERSYMAFVAKQEEFCCGPRQGN
ncbi:MAG: hypothetical protein ACXVKH_11260 [Candidatus Angelobacter sp.]